MSKFMSFIFGLLFALGLGVSGMTQPEKIIGFLDFTGDWDYSLIFVMFGAAGVYMVGFPLVKRRAAPIFAPKFALPTRVDVDKPLIIGAALFGIGWALSGYCPGPALTSLTQLDMSVFTFLAAMIAGMLAYQLYEKLKSPAQS